MTTTVPPNDPTAETNVLGALVTNPGHVDKALDLDLDVDDFYRAAHGAAWRALVDLDAAGKKIDAEAVAALVDDLDEDEVDRWYPAYGHSVGIGPYIDTLKAVTERREKYTEGHRLMRDAAPEQEGQAGPDSPKKVDLGWPVLDRAAHHGLAGDIVRALAPHTEADPVGLLVTLLLMVGNAAGPAPHATVGAVTHPARLFAVQVGETSRGRKGQGKAEVERVMAQADPGWAAGNIVSGLASGEGVISRVRDGQDDEDPGVIDKRLLVYEPEWSKVAKVGQREGNTLSPVVREAWDSGRLETLTRRDPMKATGAHVSILGHITVPELVRSLTDTDAANGYANRHLFVLVKRARLLPHGGSLPDGELDDLGRRLRDTLTAFRRFGRLMRTPEADRRWEVIYREIDETPDPGELVGAVTARAEAQVLRLSLIYALLDCSKVIDLPHLEAAWAVWNYCYQSAVYIWGDASGDEVVDRLLAALRDAGDAGLTGTEQRNLFSRHVDTARLDSARKLLEAKGLAKTEQVQTGGRPLLVTTAIRDTDR